MQYPASFILFNWRRYLTGASSVCESPDLLGYSVKTKLNYSSAFCLIAETQGVASLHNLNPENPLIMKILIQTKKRNALRLYIRGIQLTSVQTLNFSLACRQ